MINGTIIKIQSQKESDWGRYTIDSLGKDILAVGVIPGASLGMNVSLEGGIETNKYGKQFKISAVLATEEDKFAGVRTFLANGYMKGIGLKTANEMIKTFGTDCIDMFETEKGRKQLESVKGLGKKSIANACESYEENKKYKDIVLFLNGAGTKAQVIKIYNKFGDKALKTLKKNPYCLQMELSGFGFKKADAIALGAGVKTNSIYRIMAGIKYTIENAQSSEGHCYLPMADVEKLTLPLLAPLPKLDDISERVAENALADWFAKKEQLIVEHDPSAKTLKELAETAESRKLIKESMPEALDKAIEDGYLFNDEGNIYTDIMHATETSVATMVYDMCSKHKNPVRNINEKTIEAVIEDVEKRKTAELKAHGGDVEFKITDEQRSAVYLGLNNRLCIISGGPGRGKTAISEIIAKTFIQSGKRPSKQDILMLAPTGKAARRITESTGYSAMTVHRAVLAVTSKEDLPEGKLILVDESSMVDIFLMQKIMKFAQNCNLIFVGDVNQIASVGPGKVLRDLIESDAIPYIILKKGHRNSGSIAKNAELINSGFKHDRYFYDEHFIYKAFRPEYEMEGDGRVAVDKNGDYIIKTKATEFMRENLVNDYIDNITRYGIQNVMLCVAMKERGDICTTKLNAVIQERLTTGKPEAKFGTRLFRVGDRVMQIKNDYNFVKVNPDKTRSAGVCNGETGTIIKMSYDYENQTPQIVVQFDDGCLGGYTKSSIQNLQLAYAITVHKCQGSEAECVMMAYSFSDYMLLNRSLFYTGETRSKKVCFLYGEEKIQYGKMVSAFDIAVNKTDDSKRNTMLCERIKALVS